LKAAAFAFFGKGAGTMRVHPARLEGAMTVLFLFAVVATVLYMLDYAGVITVIPVFMR
jgi:hypothetical protein